MSKPILTRKRRAALEDSKSRSPQRYESIERLTGASSRSIAHHEASHTLMAAFVGLPWKRVVMLPTPQIVWDHDDVWRARPCSRAIVSAAGPAADTYHERFHPEDGEIHAAGSAEDMMAVQSCAILALGLAPENKGSGERLRLLQLTPEQSEKVRLWMASVHMMALEWVFATADYRRQVAQMLHDRGQLSPSDIDCPPAAISEQTLFSRVIEKMVWVKSLPIPAPELDGKMPHLARADMLISKLAEKAAEDADVMTALDRAVRRS